MSFYRAKFPWATILPKMHVMEDHVVPWLKRFHVGAGLMGEQGAESIHEKLERDFRGITDDLDCLKYIVKEQALYTAPSLSSLRPRRKIDDESSDDSSDEEWGNEPEEEEDMAVQPSFQSLAQV